MTTHTTTPNNIPAEEALIGAILYNCNIGMFAASDAGITPESFFSPECRRTFQAMVTLSKTNKPIDVITVGKIVKNVSAARLDEYVDKCTTVAHAGYYAKEIKEKEHARRYLEAMDKAHNDISNGGDLSNAMEYVQNETIAMGISSDVAISKVGDFTEEKCEQWRGAVGQGFVGIPSGFEQINKYLGGYRRGVVSMLGAYRGVGKSTLARQEALSMAKAGYKVAYITIEDAGGIASACIVGNSVDTSVYHLDVGNGTDHQIDKMEKGFAEINDLPLWIVHKLHRIQQIVNAIESIKRRHGLDIAFVDHIHHITPRQLPHHSRADTVSVYTHALTQCANRNDIHICIQAQLNRSAEIGDRKPRLSDLKDSGTLEEAARQVLLLSRDKETDLFNLEIAKNSYGPANIDIILEGNHGKQRFEVCGEVDGEEELI